MEKIVKLEDAEWSQVVTLIATTLVNGHPIAGKIVSQLTTQAQQQQPMRNGDASPGLSEQPHLGANPPRAEAEIAETDHRDSPQQRPPRSSPKR
jgi:hypothetical protein